MSAMIHWREKAAEVGIYTALQEGDCAFISSRYAVDYDTEVHCICTYIGTALHKPISITSIALKMSCSSA